MSDTRIKIDLAQGIIEAEGSENFVRSIYDDFKEKLTSSATASSIQRVKPKAQTKEQAKGTKGKKIAGIKKPPQLVKELDLSGGNSNPSLKDFYAQYKAKSNFEKNLLFVYYLQHRLDFSPISVDHVFTCYRNIQSIKVPKALHQSLIDTARLKGWLDTSSLDNITTTIAGTNYIEHDMTKAEDK